jgi:ATP-dependent DNA helicase PIF1
LNNVGIYLPKDIFSHGQYYVAILRVTRKEGLKILIYDNGKIVKYVFGPYNFS